VTIGVIFLIAIARKVWRGDFDVERRGFFTRQEGVLRDRRNHRPVLALVDLVWVFHLAFFYLW